MINTVNKIYTLGLILLSAFSTSVISADSNNSSKLILDLEPNYLSLSTNDTTQQILNYNYSSDKIHLASENEDWIKTQINKQENYYSISTDRNLSFGNEVSIAWNLSKFLKVNLNVFENQLQENEVSSFNGFNNSFNKSAPQVYTNEINRSISGYKFGISSELGLGNNYKLGLNLDYGQLDGADLIGFNNDEISTTSFALGIRKSKFGAYVNTDIFLEENIDLMETSRLGFEIDWYFSEETKISLGSKQRMNNTKLETNNSLDSLTGNVQYIKFQHNLY